MDNIIDIQKYFKDDKLSVVPDWQGVTVPIALVRRYQQLNQERTTLLEKIEFYQALSCTLGVGLLIFLILYLRRVLYG